MSEFTGNTGRRDGATAVVHESYSFACMRCGHGWEQSYEIEHHVDGAGHEFVLHVADGRVVPSPLSRPACAHCGGHIVRIMRPGRVSSARDAARRPERRPPAPVPTVPPARHHWQLSDLLHPFQRKAG
ncbi:hypothetical protein [Streptomyces chromofuscus]|uniref:C2H2-type domain-containing protein n=1 Tax=Streptomyces chromofuscus TaxID=42881 RepID=A0A7M2TIM7_STRCW|nr:hypothetical protein [Streptomyces chromofuscus]QOV47121.1 hypothetical protein IPT68_15310 [Streptomyces chromofuscus]GGT26515.1 hypothetical protein GCM10010254_53750 [Streptomyces chromofuscus]